MKKYFTLLFLLFPLLSLFSQTGCWSKVAASHSQTLAIKNDGTLWCWGANNYGQVGIGSTVSQFTPVQIGTQNTWAEVAVSDLSSFAIQQDGSLWAWGYNGYGMLGNGTTTQRNSPVHIGTASYKKVTANSFATLAIRTDGTLWAWGNNDWPLFGNGTSNTSSSVPLQVGTGNDWKQVVLGIYHVAAIKNDGTLWGWGSNIYGITGNGTPTPTLIPVQTAVGTSWKDVACGNDSTLAIKTDGTLWAWGTNQLGMFGNGSNEGYSYVPVQIGTADNWKEIDADFSSCIAVKTNGTLWGWGFNSTGALGNGTSDDANVPTQSGTSANWKTATMGVQHAAGIQNDGSLWTWGRNMNGQLGNGSSDPSLVPIDIGCPTALGIVAFPKGGSVIVSPNPVADVLYITSDHLIDRVVISDMTGKILLERSGSGEIDVRMLVSGLYVLQTFSDGVVGKCKFLKL